MTELTDTQLLEALVVMLRTLINNRSIPIDERFDLTRLCLAANECLEELRNEG
jgi:hypothetical protein